MSPHLFCTRDLAMWLGASKELLIDPHPIIVVKFKGSSPLFWPVDPVLWRRG